MFNVSQLKEISPDEFGFGKTKIFVKSPETIFAIEELLEQKVNPEGIISDTLILRHNVTFLTITQSSVVSQNTHTFVCENLRLQTKDQRIQRK